MAYDAELDLVEISPGAEPPVCRIMDYGKYRFELNKKLAAAKKKQKNKKSLLIRCKKETRWLPLLGSMV